MTNTIGIYTTLSRRLLRRQPRPARTTLVDRAGRTTRSSTLRTPRAGARTSHPTSGREDLSRHVQARPQRTTKACHRRKRPHSAEKARRHRRTQGDTFRVRSDTHQRRPCFRCERRRDQRTKNTLGYARRPLALTESSAQTRRLQRKQCGTFGIRTAVNALATRGPKIPCGERANAPLPGQRAGMAQDPQPQNVAEPRHCTVGTAPLPPPAVASPRPLHAGVPPEDATPKQQHLQPQPQPPHQRPQERAQHSC